MIIKLWERNPQRITCNLSILSYYLFVNYSARSFKLMFVRDKAVKILVKCDEISW